MRIANVESRVCVTLMCGMWLMALVRSVAAETTNGIAAIVNDDIITDADVASSINALQEDEPAEIPQGVKPAEMRLAVLRHLIEQRLILQEAKREGIVVTSEEVMERIDTLRRRFDSEDAFTQSMEAAHLTRELLKEKLREQLLVQHLIDAKVRSAIVVSPQEVAQAAASHPELAKPGERVRAAHLLVRVNAQRAEAAARERIEEIRRQLEAGADFSVLAKRYSEDPHAEDGGEMGWVAQGELMPGLDGALTSLAPGAYSQPIRTRLGFHLIKVEERRSVDTLSMMEANHAIYQQKFQQKYQEAFTRWLTQLKRRAYIDILSSS